MEERKKQVNLYLNIELLNLAQRKANQKFMKFNAYVTQLILDDLGLYQETEKNANLDPLNDSGEALGEEMD